MDRPRAITVIAWLNIVTGVIALLTQWEFLLNPGQLREPLLTIGSSVSLYLFQTGLVSIALIASGIGLLTAKSWSWLASVILQCNAIIFAVYSMVIIGSSMPAIVQVKQLIPLAVSILILVYLLRSASIDYFGVHRTNIGNLLSYAFSSNIGLVVLLGMVR